MPIPQPPGGTPFPFRVPPPTRPAPSSTYTKDVIARGSAAVTDRRNARGQVEQTPAQAWLASQHAPPSSGTDPALQSFYESRGFHPQYDTTFGQTKKGAYSGFKTEGELKSAITGRADTLRTQDHSAAQQLSDQASMYMADLAKQYNDQRATTDPRLAKDVATAIGGDLGHLTDLSTTTAPVAAGGLQGAVATHTGNPADDALAASAPRIVQGPVGSGLSGGMIVNQGHPDNGFGLDGSAPVAIPASAGQRAAGEQAGARVHDTQTYLDNLDKWMAEQSAPYQQAQQTAADVQSVPLRDYQGIAGGEYGVDPNLIAGWYPQSGRISDFNTQRDLQSLDQNGVPFAEYQRYLDSQTTQANQQDSAAAAADKQAVADQAQQSADYVQQTTGFDAKQLAGTANMTVDQLAQTVADPGYQAASSDLESVLFDPAFTKLDPQKQSDAVNPILDQFRGDPQTYRLLQAVYGAYLG